MLSDETANGKFPIETVSAMRRTILYTQEHASVDPIHDIIHGKNDQQNAIAAAAVKLAVQLGVDAIVAETKSGATAEAIAAHRPNLPIISVSSEPRAAQQLALSYANRSFIRPDGETAGWKLAHELKSSGYFGDTSAVMVAIVSGRQPGLTGGTDTIRVRVIE